MGLNLFLTLRSYSSWASCIIVYLFAPLGFVWYTSPTQQHHLDTNGATQFQRALQIVFVRFAAPCGAYLLYVDLIKLRVGWGRGSIDKFFLTITLFDPHASRHTPGLDPDLACTLGSTGHTLPSDIPSVYGENCL